MLTDILLRRTIYFCQLVLCQPQILIGKTHRHTSDLIIVLIEYILCSSFIDLFLLSVIASIANILVLWAFRLLFEAQCGISEYYHYICITNQSIVIRKQIKTYGIAKDKQAKGCVS